MSFAHPDPYRAVAYKTLSVLFFVLMASFVKAASDDVPVGEAMFFRSIFALPLIFIWLWARGFFPHALKTDDPVGHAWRGFVGSLSMGASFAGLAVLPLYEVKAIQYAMPLFVVALAAIMLGETVRKVRLTAVALGMAGVAVIIWPRLTAFTGGTVDARVAAGALVVLGGSFCAAMAQTFIRRLVETEESAAIVFWFTVTTTVVGLLTLPLGLIVPIPHLEWTLPAAWPALMLILAGLCGGAGQILLTESVRYAHASVVAPFEYTSMIFAVAIGWAVFGDRPTVAMIVGSGLVIAAGVLIILRERYLKIRRGEARVLAVQDS